MSLPALLALGFAAAWLATGLFLSLARTRGWGKAVRRDGPEGHLRKEGTPTMGGAAFLGAGLVVAAVTLLRGDAGSQPLPGASEGPPGDLLGASSWAVLALIAASAALGLWDDLTSLDRKRRAAAGTDATTGVLARWRILAQSAVALAFSIWAVAAGRELFGVAWLDVLGFAFIVVGTVNAVNFADGLDGLAAGLAGIALLAFWGDPLAAVLLGTVLAFLWFNAHPARVFMGGVGSEALGAALAGLAIVHGDAWRLPLLALVPLLEVVSVIVQVGWFRASGGRRLLKMSPLHHHFELSGWPETRVVVRFWIVAALAVALAVASRAWW